MAQTEQLKASVATRQANAVREAVAAGDYATTSEVVQDALRLWETRRQVEGRDVEILRKRWDTGKASGRAGALDVKELVADERRKQARKR